MTIQNQKKLLRMLLEDEDGVLYSNDIIDAAFEVTEIYHILKVISLLKYNPDRDSMGV